MAGLPPPAELGEGVEVTASSAGPLRSRCDAGHSSFVQGQLHCMRWPSRTSGVCCVGPAYSARNTPLCPPGHVSNHPARLRRPLRQFPHPVAWPQPRSRCWAARPMLGRARSSPSSRPSW
ncbi:hypothetical protein T12_15095 [Trichinella patagoniensis]|uniref:Uncharacterized protein n=1 Tax=Trichinella patagoniensis TaxID=990121 RepID=A0A0V1AG30_9BILA|nr:hypothetical protein T12_15095 [Trichinella patagoniensis]